MWIEFKKKDGEIYTILTFDRNEFVTHTEKVLESIESTLKDPISFAITGDDGQEQITFTGQIRYCIEIDL